MDGSASTLPADDEADDQNHAPDENDAENEDDSEPECSVSHSATSITQNGRRPKKNKRYSVVDRRQQQKNHFGVGGGTEERALLAHEREDSDLEQNIGRLCQYLSGSEDGEEQQEQEQSDVNRKTKTAFSTPRAELLLNSQRRRRSVDSTASSLSSADEQQHCRTHAAMPSETATDSSPFAGQIIPMHRLVPRDFLNIPPPAQPPPMDDSPANERPLPPQRTLPPVPDEDQYEEAKPAPLPPMPTTRTSKQLPSHLVNKNNPNNRLSGKAISPAASSSSNGHHAPLPPLVLPKPHQCLPAQGGQYTDIDCYNCGPQSVLERNETGSYYVASGQTTMSSISPSRKSDMEQNRNNNYSLLPGGQAPVSLPALPLRQDMLSGHFRKPLKNMNFRGGKNEEKFAQTCCSWRCLAYSLGVVLLFALPVIIYLSYAVFATSSSAATHMTPQYSPSHFNDATPSPAEDNAGTALSTLRPMPESFSLGDEVVVDLLPEKVMHTFFTLQRDAYVQFNFTVDNKVKLVVYGRETLRASPTQYDFIQAIHGDRLQHVNSGDVAVTRYKRASLRSSVFVQYLTGVRWFLAIFNDDKSTRTIRFSASLSGAEGMDCKYSCHNKGVCKEGTCFCFDGYEGTYCNEPKCPVLCNGRGIFHNGQCACNVGWKGVDCDVPSNVCDVPDCNGHGQCNNNGECQCDGGYKGRFCEQRVCPQDNCSDHGVCHNGKCYCDFGYKGERCDVLYTSEALCPVEPNQCGGRGRFDQKSSACVCQDGWTGSKCDKKICDLNCGQRGICLQDACVCDDGWTGERCEFLACAPGCEENGKCVNGTCLCKDGWNGENCQLAGCPNACTNQGECARVNGLWTCRCRPDFQGVDCSNPIERQCSDKIDNDGDGLTDCEDSECCNNKEACKNDQHCQTVVDPYRVLMRKPASSPQSQFHQKISFLLDPDSVHLYSHISTFNESRISVVRGRVVNAKSSPLVAIRVDNAASPQHGFTLSRNNGEFDLVVDGGGAVTLQFMRSQFLTRLLTVRVPWNQIVYVGDVVLATKTTKEVNTTAGADTPSPWSEACVNTYKSHYIKPYALPSWKHGRRGLTASASGVVADAAAVQQSLRVPGTDVFLNYFTANAQGYESTLILYLVPSDCPKTLRLVRLAINVEGSHFETVLEAKANLSYVYGWDKKNVYKQRVSGLVSVKVSIGYVYASCERTLWETLSLKLNGYTESISDIGGWSLNIHHRYNILDNVLELGDGGVVFLREEPRLLVNTVGSKEQRKLTCDGEKCNGPAAGAQLYFPMAVASSKDSSLYIGDFNLIRRLTKDSRISTVLELSISDTSHRYYLAAHPVSGDLYVSLPLRRQVWKIKNPTPSPGDVANNYEVIVGTGDMCSVDGTCGDNDAAEQAQLNYPKGIAFDAYGNLYIADDKRVRLVSNNGLITTVVGGATDRASYNDWRPSKCITTFEARTFDLQWPTSLSFDYSTRNLLFLDSDVIYELGAGDSIVSVRAGSPPHCTLLTNVRNETVRPVALKGVTSMAVTVEGGIVVSEVDGKRINRIRSIDRYGRVSFVAGVDSKCDCHRRHCPCDDQQANIIAREAHFHNPVSVTVDENSFIHIADQANFKIRTLRASAPTMDSSGKFYEIVAADAQEIYYFNRFGQHVSTKDMLTDRYIYNFTYHLDASYGKLNGVYGSGGHKISIFRKSNAEIVIENTDGLKSVAHISTRDRDPVLKKFVAPGGAVWHFNYVPNTGLLANKVDETNRCWFYEYDPRGRLTRVVAPTGNELSLNYALYKDRLIVDARNSDGQTWALSLSDGEIKVKGGAHDRSIFSTDRSTHAIYTGDGVSVQYDGGVHSTFDLPQPTILRRKLILSPPDQTSAQQLVSKLEWRYYAKRAGRTNYKRIVQVGRKTRVNGVNVLTVEFDREKNFDMILNQNNAKILTVFYNSAGFVTQWAPASSSISVMNSTYDSLGRLINRNWGVVGRNYKYDLEGRLIETSETADFRRSQKYSYAGLNTKPATFDQPSGSRYQIRYDSNGNLANITTPTGLRYEYFQQNELGSSNYLVYTPFSTNPHVLSKRSDGSISATYHGYDARRVAYFYDAFSRLVRTVFDKAETKFEYDDKSGSLKFVVQRNIDFTVQEIDFRYQGHHISEITDRRFSPRNKKVPFPVHVSYQYDDRLRLTTISSIFDDTKLPPSKIEYDAVSGRPKSVNGYQYEFVDNKIRLFNERSSVETTLTPNMAISQTRFTVKGRAVCEQHAFYDGHGRMISVTFNAPGEKQSGSQYEYDADGRLTSSKLAVNGAERSTWSYEYDSDGTITKINNVLLKYDRYGHIAEFGQVIYGTDRNGFIITRGEENFDYDSRGRLTRARKSNVYDNRYFYDHRDRLITVERTRAGKIYHFYYTSPNKPNLITHIYDLDSRTVAFFIYDHHDRLTAIESNGVYHFVACLPDGTPSQIYSEDSTLTKTILRSPFGAIEADQSIDFPFFVGYKGMFQDMDNGVVIFGEGRPYDTKIGRWMAADVERFFKVDLYRPDISINPFIFRDPVNKPFNFDIGINKWLEFMGYDVNELIPLLNPAKGYTFTCEENSGLLISNECSLRKRIESFHTFLSVRKSPLLPETPFSRKTPLTFSPITSAYGEFSVVVKRDDKVKIYVAASESENPIISLLNNSKILPVFSVVNSTSMHYFWKSSSDQAAIDFSLLGAKNGRYAIANGFNLNVTSKRNSSGQGRNYLQISAPASKFVIRYGGTDTDTETKSILDDALRRVVDAAWILEQNSVIDHEKETSWTKEERDELKLTGRVRGYEPIFRIDPSTHGALSSDPNNVKFVKRIGR